jgi:hypothetical protein
MEVKEKRPSVKVAIAMNATESTAGRRAFETL